MPHHLDKLLAKYLDGSCTEDERQLIDLWLLKRGHDDSKQIDHAREQAIKAAVLAQLQQHIYAHPKATETTHPPKSRPASLGKKYRLPLMAAAVVLVTLTAGLLYVNQQAVTRRSSIAADLYPGEAIRGRSIGYQINAMGIAYNIDSLPLNEEVHIAGAVVQKKADNILYYRAQQQNNGGAGSNYHSVSVPSGKDLHIYLPDGSKVWINTESTLHFPTMPAKKRQLYLAGEAFFEVASDKAHPFVVESRDFNVQATGTQFNVRAYADEDLQSATLVEGKVDIQSDRSLKRLLPNQQWERNGANNSTVKDVDVSRVLGNRDGYFVFQNNDIKYIMSEVARWYAVDVVYAGEIASKEFGGTFSKKRSLDELLDYLRNLGGYSISREGRRITIMP